MFECSECIGQKKPELGDMEAWRIGELRAADDERNLTVSAAVEAANLSPRLKQLNTIVSQIASGFFPYCIAELNGVSAMVPVRFGMKLKLVRAIGAAADAESTKQLMAAEAAKVAERMKLEEEAASKKKVARKEAKKQREAAKRAQLEQFKAHQVIVRIEKTKDKFGAFINDATGHSIWSAVSNQVAFLLRRIWQLGWH
jgi:hypothetical protein